MPAVSGSPTQVKTSASTAADLAGTPDDAFQEGDLACVTALWPNSTFRLRRTALGAPADNVTTIEAFSGNGYWEVFGVGGGSMLSFATVALLGAYNDLALDTGALVYVQSVRAYWTKLIEADPGTTDGITSVRNLDNTATWYRDSVASLSWQNVAAWEIAATTGSDQNTGAPGDPLATLAEFARRLPVLTQTTTVTIAEDTLEVLSGHFSAAPGVDALKLLIVGDPDVLALGTITTVAIPDSAVGVNLPGVLTASDLTPAPIDWTTFGADGKSVVEATNGPFPGYATVVIDSVGGTTGYTPEWTKGELGFEVPVNGNAIRVLGLRSAPALKIVAEGLVVGVKYLYLTDLYSVSSVVCSPLLFNGVSLETPYFDCCRIDSPYDATGTWYTKFQACILDADTGNFTLFGTGAARWIGCGVDGDFTLKSGVTLFANGSVVMVGSFRLSGESSDSTNTRPQLTIGTRGLSIFGVALSTVGLDVSSADVYVGGPLFGKTHLIGMRVKLGGAVTVKSTLADGATLTLTGTTEISVTSANGVAAGQSVPIVNGIPAGAAAMVSWANWETLNKQVINLADLTRIVGLA